MGYLETKDWTTVSFEVGRKTLREWREDQSRRSEEVVELWEHVLSRSPSSLGDEVWMIYEQVCIAALDCARYDLAMECIQELDKRFPRSNRVLKLQAMRYEALEQYSSAVSLYDKLLEADSTNNSYRKRKVSILMAQGKRLDAIKELNEYLKIYINDSEAWLQLSELFLLESDFSKAAHCLEECLLAAPLNALYLRRLADIRYTQGGQDNVEIAKSYYEQAYKLNPEDVRSQYGLLLCATQLAQGKISAEKKKELSSSGAAIAEKIAEHYDELTGINPEAPQLADLVRTIGKQMDGLEERLSEVERVLGISELSEVNAADLDVESLRNSLLSKGCSQVFKIKMEDLQKLKSTMTEPNMKPLDEKLNTVQFCEDLIRKRIDLLEEWDANIQPVLDSEAIPTSEQHSAALDGIEKDLNESLATYQREVLELMIFYEDFKKLMNTLNQRVETLNSKVRNLEKKKEAV
ncbi:unnamed protein product, partial [Mesorhabditis belari]|uniref:ER membrane protein complex subunit 2 n=1 Tax=Mesorhabditis belari TaxID=2138241 RepID=A0AAF3J3F4_9BILA